MSKRAVFVQALLPLLTLAFIPAATASAQGSAPDLLDHHGMSRRHAHAAVTRARGAHVNAGALDASRLTLTLFDDVTVVARRTSSSHSRAGSTVWFGKVEWPSQGTVTLALVNGVLAGSVSANGRTFEIGYAGNGLHEVREVDPAQFPTEDPPGADRDLLSSSGSATVSAPSSAVPDAAGQIDVMVVWTAKARNAVGGTAAAIQSLVDLAVANANAAYANSQIGTSLRLVYSGEVNYTESAISTDLSQLARNGDGILDQVHVLRNQYAADIVTLLGDGYAGAGSCGIGYLMSSVSTSFASTAFNVVDQSCAGGYLSYAHEVGHNEGLHHDPANASGTPSYAYAYGYQDPGGAFRTVMSYGGAPRVPQFSNPNVLYAGRPTGTSAQNNAAALNNTAATVANFRSAAPQACSYTVTPTAAFFSETGGTATAAVTTSAGCAWTTTSGASWVSVGPGGSGPGSVVLTVAANGGSARIGSATVAGTAVSISEAGVAPACTFTVSPTSVSFASGGGTAQVNVTTAAGCTWSSSGGTSWLTVSGAGTGSGTVSLTAAANTASGSRSASALVAGKSVSVSESGMKGRGKR